VTEVVGVFVRFSCAASLWGVNDIGCYYAIFEGHFSLNCNFYQLIENAQDIIE
jgi:hypothetical protein